MGKYIKVFDAHSAYNAYINSQDKILPNVSYCKDNNEVHYNPWADPRLIAKFNVEDDSETTMIYGGMVYNEISVLDNFTEIEVDGVEISLTDLDENYGFYQLSEGEHTIKYTLSDPTEISNGAFNDCSSLTSVTIPNSVTSIGGYAFEYCSGLTSITIPNGVTSIGEGAFSSCDGLTSVTIPDSVTSIGAISFSGCRSLTSITVESGNSVYDSRNNCNAIIETSTNTLITGCQNTVIPNTVTSIGEDAFSYCSSLTSITIPDSVTSIGGSAFEYCSGLTSITIGNNVTSIGQNAFKYCDGLTSVTIGSGVVSIGDMAFVNCSGLTSITIPNGVTSIGQSAFNGCRSLTSITSLATTAPTIQTDTFRNAKTGGTLYVPSGSTGYNTWMGTGDYYLGKYNWTKVEQ